ncbi:hypothetical protein OBBRIDRAFT_729606, partial [Obba rivulosa]
AAKASVPKMSYKNFDIKIIAYYGVVIKGWPLDKFVPPSLIKSQTELKVLLWAWETNTIHFYKLTNEEF